jgi:hypothetical protein
MDFTGVYLKLHRASHHLDSLKTELDNFLYGNPDSGSRLVVGPDADDGTWKVTTYRSDRFLLAWSVLIGEAVYQLRSSLDHLINGLIPTPTRNSAFPILCDETAYDANAASHLPGLPEPYLTLVRDLQPFRQNPAAPMSTTLWNLSEWARLDRHRFLHIADIWITECVVGSFPDGRITLDHSVVFPSPLEDGAVIGSGRILADPAGTKTKVDVHVHATLDLVLTQLGDMRIPAGMMAVQAVGGLEAFLAHIFEIVAVFENPVPIVTA